jgi:hypothetical protein
MLWNPKHDAKPKVDPLSVAGLVAWLETQPEDTEYDADDGDACVCKQYLRAIGLGHLPYDAAIPNGATRIKITFWGPPTFGAALHRARAYL